MPLTGIAQNGENGIVLRRALLALLLCIIGWATPALVTPAPHTAAGVVPLEASLEADASERTQNPDLHWDAQRRASFSSTQSLWKSASIHAELAHTVAGEAFVATGTHQLPRSRTHRPSGHLLSTPLLI